LPPALAVDCSTVEVHETHPNRATVERAVFTHIHFVDMNSSVSANENSFLNFA
jgi:hypothetical protein